MGKTETELAWALQKLRPISSRAWIIHSETGAAAVENLLTCVDAAIKELEEAIEFYAADYDRHSKAFKLVTEEDDHVDSDPA